MKTKVKSGTEINETSEPIMGDDSSEKSEESNSGSPKGTNSEIVTQTLSMREVNKRRVAKARITADFIRKLPDGIIYDEDASSDCEEPKQVSELADLDDSEEFKEGDIVKVGKFTINIERVTKA